jgi:hypothetical protein
MRERTACINAFCSDAKKAFDLSDSLYKDVGFICLNTCTDPGCFDSCKTMIETKEFNDL